MVSDCIHDIAVAARLTIAKQDERALAADNNSDLKLEAFAEDVVFCANHGRNLAAVLVRVGTNRRRA